MKAGCFTSFENKCVYGNPGRLWGTIRRESGRAICCFSSSQCPILRRKWHGGRASEGSFSRCNFMTAWSGGKMAEMYSIKKADFCGIASRNSKIVYFLPIFGGYFFLLQVHKCITSDLWAKRECLILYTFWGFWGFYLLCSKKMNGIHFCIGWKTKIGIVPYFVYFLPFMRGLFVFP